MSGNRRRRPPEKLFVPDIPDELYEHFENMVVSEDAKNNDQRVLQYRLLRKVFQNYPESSVKLYQGIKEAAYAIWTKKPRIRIATNCETRYLLFDHLTNLVTSSAIIAARLISIARHRSGVDKEFIDYSPQYLLDAFNLYFTPQRKRLTNKKSKVTAVSILDAIKYARDNKIPTAIDWQYLGFSPNIPEHHEDVSLFEVVGVTKKLNLDSALDILQYQPVAAKLCVFYPEYEVADAGDGIYRGPIYLKKDTGKKPSWERLYDVMVCQTYIMEGELVARVKFPSSDVPYLNVSLDVCLTNDNIEGIAAQEPTHLLRDFIAILPGDDASSSQAPTP